MSKSINAKTHLYGLFADPHDHSKSPEMYNTFFEQNGINAVYLSFKVNHTNIESAIASIRSLDLKGVNVSMPNKVSVMNYLDSIDKAADLMGAVNCIVSDSGKLIGYNTDGLGFTKNLEAHGLTLENNRIVVFGLGGVGKAIIVQAALSNVKEISVFNIQDENFTDGKLLTERLMKKTGIPVFLNDFSDTHTIQEMLNHADIVINATSVGMNDFENQSPLPVGCELKSHQSIVDVIYNPEETLFLKNAAAIGCRCINGEGMLKHQGLENLKLWKLAK